MITHPQEIAAEIVLLEQELARTKNARHLAAIKERLALLRAELEGYAPFS